MTDQERYEEVKGELLEVIGGLDFNNHTWPNHADENTKDAVSQILSIPHLFIEGEGGLPEMPLGYECEDNNYLYGQAQEDMLKANYKRAIDIKEVKDARANPTG